MSIDVGRSEKRCGRCGEIKPIAEFAWRRKAKGQRHNYCRACHSAYHREHYLANKQRYVDQAGVRAKHLARERAIYLVEYFRAHPCTDCGEYDPVVLEFDHIGKKSFAIGSALRDRNWESILDEMTRCEVVCANCHRRRTAKRGGFVRAAVVQR